MTLPRAAIPAMFSCVKPINKDTCPRQIDQTTIESGFLAKSVGPTGFSLTKIHLKTELHNGESSICVHTWIIYYMAELLAASLCFLLCPKSFGRTDLKQAWSQTTSSNEQNGLQSRERGQKYGCTDDHKPVVPCHACPSESDPRVMKEETVYTLVLHYLI